MKKPHRTFWERSYEPMSPRSVLLAWAIAYALAFGAMGLQAALSG